jgi:hypothetical protein
MTDKHPKRPRDTEMHQVNARHEIIREWRSLPKELRQTDEQAAENMEEMQGLGYGEAREYRCCPPRV